MSVATDPWTISFSGPELRQAEPRSFLITGRWPPGPLPPPDEDPDTNGHWYYATRLVEDSIEDQAYRATVATDLPTPQSAPPAVANIEIQVRDRGTVSVTAQVAGAAVCRQRFVAEERERFLGFGERSHAASLERGVIENYVGEGPYQSHEHQFLDGIVPPWGVRNRPDATYFPISLGSFDAGVWVSSTATRSATRASGRMPPIAGG